MKEKNIITNPLDRPVGLLQQKKSNKQKNNLSGYPTYPSSEDIYSKNEEMDNINPEDITQTKAPKDKFKSGKEVNDDFGSDLDIPGSELDDDQENIGSEDEENNYYSLGDDDINDSDEDQKDR